MVILFGFAAALSILALAGGLLIEDTAERSKR